MRITRTLAAGGGFVVLVALALIAGIFGGAGFEYWSDQKAPQPATEPQPPRLYSRDEFKQLLLHKTEAEVVDVVGRPYRTSHDSDTLYWHYPSRTKDPQTSRPDSDAQVIFREGKVVSINY